MSEGIKTPLVTVDIIIEVADGIVLIERKNPPYGWALPGGFVDYGESLERAAVREAKEETSLEVELSHNYTAIRSRDAIPAVIPCRPFSSPAPKVRRAEPTTPKRPGSLPRRICRPRLSSITRRS